MGFEDTHATAARFAQNSDPGYVYSGSGSAQVSNVFRAGFQADTGSSTSSVSFWVYPVGEQTRTYRFRWASFSLSCGGSGFSVGAESGGTRVGETFTAEPFVWTRIQFPIEASSHSLDAQIEIRAVNADGTPLSSEDIQTYYLDEFKFVQ